MAPKKAEPKGIADMRRRVAAADAVSKNRAAQGLKTSPAKGTAAWLPRPSR